MLIEKLRDDALAARRAVPRQEVLVNLLTTVLAEAERVGKDDGNRQTTDDETIRVLRKFQKNAEDMLALRPDFSQTSLELVYLRRYLPEMMADDALKVAIQKVVEDHGVELHVRSTGVIVGHLNAAYPGQIDAKAVSQALRS